MSLRFARPEDGPALVNIYAQYIHTSITFECALPSPAEFSRRIEEVSAAYPYLVWEADGRLLGYAYAHRQKEREAYQWNAELSVYLDPSCHAKGLGRLLYTRLMAILREQGVKNVYGVVAQPNEKSCRLHETLGFHCLGVYRNTGYKNGAWHDVACYEKALGPYTLEPSPFLPIGLLSQDRLTALLREDCFQ